MSHKAHFQIIITKRIITDNMQVGIKHAGISTYKFYSYNQAIAG